MSSTARQSPSPSSPASAPSLQAWQVSAGGIAGLVLTIGLARFAYTPLLPVMQAQTGLGDAAAGSLAAVNYAGYMCGALLAAWVEDPRWRHRLYLWGLLVALGSTAMMAASPQGWVWALSRFLGGLSGAAGLLLCSGLVLGWLMRAGRRPELGVHFSGLGLGIVVSAVGAMLMGLWQWNWAAQWWGFAAVGLPLALLAWRWAPPPPPAAPAGAPAGAPNARWMRWMLAAYFCAGWGFVIGATFTVTIVERQPLLAGQGPWAWLLVGLSATPAVFVWDRMARRLGDVNALMVAFVLQIGSVLLPALSGSLAAALLGALLYGGTAIGIVSMTLALVGRRSPGNPGKAMARLTLSYGAAQITAPALAGAMAQASGHYQAALWITAAVMSAGLAILVVLRGLEGGRQG